MGNAISYTDTPFDLDLGAKGTIRGLQRDNKARRYAGIPYALPPTGEHRWRKPRLLPLSYRYEDASGGAYDATKFRAVCPQKAFHVVDAEGGSGAYSEDCLMLNIWTPVAKPENGGKWPVMLWLHGGWFQMGDPSQEDGMDPTELISTGGLNAIVVAIGYRLNVFGFLSGQALLEESDGVSAGNLGLWDQRQAIEWVRDNIHLFGGDAENVTLAGRSAGAYSVEAQVLYEFRGTDRAFRKAFMDSNAIPAQPKTLADTEGQFDELCVHFEIEKEATNARKLEILRGKTSLELVKATAQLKNHTFRPVTDNLMIHDGMVSRLQSKAFAEEFTTRGFRLLIGEVKDEETLYAAYNGPSEPTIEALRLQVSNYYSPEATDRAIESFGVPESDDLKEWQDLFGRMIADGQVRAPSRALVNSLAGNGVSIRDLWRFQIGYRLSFIDNSVAPESFGVAHAMDKPFWNFAICHGPTDEERTLMREWAQILVAFVNDDQEYDFGTKEKSQVKVITSEGRIEIQEDPRWDELIRRAQVFSGEEAGREN